MSAAQINTKAFDQIALPYATLTKVIESITDTVDADQIYVFGSYARGDQNSESDLDLYVVSKDDTNRFAQMGQIGRSLLWMKMPKDVLVSSKSRFDMQREDPGSIESVITREGVLLYG